MNNDRPVRDLVSLVARVVLGGSMAAHGLQKLYGWFDGPGFEAAAGMMKSLGWVPGERYARAASMTETASGVLIALGAGGPLGPAMVAAVMTSAVGSVHVSKGYWNTSGGFELNVMYATLALLLASDDYGRLSLDEVIGLRARIPRWISLLAFAGGVGAGIAMLQQRTPDKPSSVVIGEVEPSERQSETTYAPGM